MCPACSSVRVGHQLSTSAGRASGSLVGSIHRRCGCSPIAGKITPDLCSICSIASRCSPKSSRHHKNESSSSRSSPSRTRLLTVSHNSASLHRCASTNSRSDASRARACSARVASPCESRASSSVWSRSGATRSVTNFGSMKTRLHEENTSPVSSRCCNALDSVVSPKLGVEATDPCSYASPSCTTTSTHASRSSCKGIYGCWPCFLLVMSRCLLYVSLSLPSSSSSTSSPPLSFPPLSYSSSPSPRIASRTSRTSSSGGRPPRSARTTAIAASQLRGTVAPTLGKRAGCCTMASSCLRRARSDALPSATAHTHGIASCTRRGWTGCPAA